MTRNSVRTALLGGVTLAALALPSTAATAATTSFSNPATITIDSGPATPYPSNVEVAGLCGTVTDADVTLHSLTHTFADDIDVLLVSPSGQKTLLMSDTGGGAAMTNVTLTFDDASAAPLPNETAITPGTYRPTDFEPGDVFETPAPVGPYVASLAVFNGTAPNGAWQLFVRDDNGGFVGSITGGWTLTLATGDCPPPPPPPPPDPPPPDPPPPDTTAPETIIVSGPVKTDKPKVKFGFASSEVGSTFQCKLKGKQVTTIEQKQYGPCTSKKVYKGLKPGKYKFFVFATDAAGNADATPATSKLKILG